VSPERCIVDHASERIQTGECPGHRRTFTGDGTPVAFDENLVTVGRHENQQADKQCRHQEKQRQQVSLRFLDQGDHQGRQQHDGGIRIDGPRSGQETHHRHRDGRHGEQQVSPGEHCAEQGPVENRRHQESKAGRHVNNVPGGERERPIRPDNPVGDHENEVIVPNAFIDEGLRPARILHDHQHADGNRRKQRDPGKTVDVGQLQGFSGNEYQGEIQQVVPDAIAVDDQPFRAAQQKCGDQNKEHHQQHDEVRRQQVLGKKAEPERVPIDIENDRILDEIDGRAQARQQPLAQNPFKQNEQIDQDKRTDHALSVTLLQAGQLRVGQGLHPAPPWRRCPRSSYLPRTPRCA